MLQPFTGNGGVASEKLSSGTENPKQTNKQTNTTLQVRIHVLPTGTENYPPHYYFILFYLPTLYQSTANKQLVNALQAMIKILVTSLEILVYWSPHFK